MTDDRDFIAADDVDRWLKREHERFTSGLAERLDLEGGLTAASMPGDYDAIVAGLENGLDLDAGLAAVVGTAGRNEPAASTPARGHLAKPAEDPEDDAEPESAVVNPIPQTGRPIGPVFHFIVVVDVEGFGRRRIPAQAAIRKIMYEVVQDAFDDIRLSWESVERLDRGDSIIMLLPAAVATNVTLAGPFIRALDAGLREKARMYTADHQMRMRVALHQGNCQRDETGWVGEAINTSTRLVDAPQLRTVLQKATGSMMAFIMSDEIYRSVIRHDYRQIDSAAFAPVDLHVKELNETAWIHVPGYSYPPGLADRGSTGDQPTDSKDDAAPVRPPAPRQLSQANSGGFTFNGDVHVAGDQFTGNKTVHENGPKEK